MHTYICYSGMCGICCCAYQWKDAESNCQAEICACLSHGEGSREASLQ